MVRRAWARCQLPRSRGGAKRRCTCTSAPLLFPLNLCWAHPALPLVADRRFHRRHAGHRAAGASRRRPCRRASAPGGAGRCCPGWGGGSGGGERLLPGVTVPALQHSIKQHIDTHNHLPCLCDRPRPSQPAPSNRASRRPSPRRRRRALPPLAPGRSRQAPAPRVWPAPRAWAAPAR